MTRLSSIGVLVALLSACGGGGGGSDDTVTPVTANAGSDISIDEKTEFTLQGNGSPSDGTYTWQQLSGPSIEGLPANTPSLTLSAPDIKVDSTAAIKLTYTASGRQAEDTLIISMRSVNQLPEVVITKTQPESGVSDYGDTITLSSEGTLDPDENGAIARYFWQQTKGPKLTFNADNQASVSFPHPLMDTDQDVTVVLTVTDDEGGTRSEPFTFLLTQTTEIIDVKPGEPQAVKEFDEVTLDASQSQAATEFYTCQWQQTQGEQVTLTQPGQCVTQFDAPDIDSDVTLGFQVRVTDTQGRSETGTTSVTVAPKPLGLINDTGMGECFNGTGQINCGSPDFPGQDAEQGRDAFADKLDRIGDGPLAFDFTKLNQYADELPDTATTFSCVRDNITGLIWEVKQPNTGTLPNTQTREGQNAYSWYFRTSDTGDFDGVTSPANSSCPSDRDCSLQTYVDEVNATNFCNGDNWRVPTYDELLSIMNYGLQGHDSLLPVAYFPNQPSYALYNHLWYWTSQTSADGESLDFAWIIDMRSGNDLAVDKAGPAFVRLVRTP